MHPTSWAGASRLGWSVTFEATSAATSWLTGSPRVRCTDCGHDRLLAFSCKGRGVCPSCNARRMAEVASGVLGIFLRALRSTLRDVSPGAPAAVRDAQLGAIPFPQRFGGSLPSKTLSIEDAKSPHYHYHVLRWFARRGLLDPSTAADMRTWRGTGGFSIDDSVRIEAEDRAGLKRLVRYCARGRLVLERLHTPTGLEALTSPEARLVYRLPEPDVHGRQELRLAPLELLDRLARLVPPPRIHRHRHHGVLAPTGSQLLARIYEVLPLLCPACGGEMRIISFITLPATVQDLLLHLGFACLPAPPGPIDAPTITHFSVGC